jgi:hypothetical protein
MSKDPITIVESPRFESREEEDAYFLAAFRQALERGATALRLPGFPSLTVGVPEAVERLAALGAAAQGGDSAAKPTKPYRWTAAEALSVLAARLDADAAALEVESGKADLTGAVIALARASALLRASSLARQMIRESEGEGADALSEEDTFGPLGQAIDATAFALAESGSPARRRLIEVALDHLHQAEHASEGGAE